MYKILAIEKNPLFLQILKEGLTLSGFNVITVKTLDEDYQLAGLEQPDLYQVAVKRRTFSFPHLPISPSPSHPLSPSVRFTIFECNSVLVLCGYGFPTFEGLELLPALQTHPKTSTIPFLLMTGSFLEDIPDWQVHLKQDELLFKPFDLNILVQTLHLKLQWPQTQ